MRTATKFTAPRRKVILEAVEAGLPFTQAAAKAQISKQTLYNWLERGAKSPDGQYGKFAAELELAAAKAAETALGHWKEAMPDDWRAAMEYLSRRFPDDFGKRERHEVTGPSGGPVKIVLEWPTGPPPE